MNTVPRSNLLAFSISTGELLPWAPVTDGQVRAITRSPDGSRIYITGDFNRVDGVYHVRIAAFNTATNTVVAGFKPTSASAGLAIAASNTTVYAGGNFQTAASTTGGTSVPRKYLAAFDAATGALTPFVADANDAVMSLAATADGQRVVVGGRFTSLSGSPFYGLGSVHPVTGAPVSFPANAQIRNAGAESGITNLYADASGIYGTSYHFGGGGNSEGPFRIDCQRRGDDLDGGLPRGQLRGVPGGAGGVRLEPPALLREHGRLPADRAVERVPRDRVQHGRDGCEHPGHLRIPGP